MKLSTLSLLFAILFSTNLFAQENYTISGLVKEASNGETVFGASIFLVGTSVGTLSNEYGFFSITVPEGTYTLVVSFIGYSEQSQIILLDKNLNIDFEITETSAIGSLDDVVEFMEKMKV